MPDVLKSAERNKIVYSIWSKKNNVTPNIAKFQQDVVEHWNPSCKNVSRCVIPEVSLRDEVRTDGFGMAAIEMLVSCGILIEQKINDHSEWILGPDWDKKTFYLCLDGLSLDRHRCFLKRLTKSPVNFKRAYNQGKNFRKALSRAIEMPGPLHQAFHILQCVFNVYSRLLKIVARVVGWKKINYGDVS